MEKKQPSLLLLFSMVATMIHQEFSRKKLMTSEVVRVRSSKYFNRFPC